MAYTKKEVRKRPIPPHHQGNLPIPLKKLLGKKKKTQHFLLLSILFLKPKQNLAKMHPSVPPAPHKNLIPPTFDYPKPHTLTIIRPHPRKREV